MPLTSKPLTAGERGAFLLQLAEAHHHARLEVHAARMEWGRVEELIQVRQAFARRGIPEAPPGGTVSPLAEAFDRSARSLLARLKQARRTQRFVALIEDAATAEHARLSALGV